MWFKFEAQMPYHGDPDFRDALIFGIKSRLGDVPIDISYYETYGTLGVDVASEEEARKLYDLPQAGIVYSWVDRGMTRDSVRTIV